MFRQLICTIGCLAIALASYAHTHSLKGRLIDSAASPLGFASVALLNPQDSTMAYFGITTVDGSFEIRNIAEGHYLMQTAYIGFKTSYRKVDIPLKDGGVNYGDIVLRSKQLSLKTVEVVGERVPVLINGDTVEYNAGAFKTKADASTEELLKKLPGVEVDRAGNIKAQGEDVKRVLVDGKEFFGNDPKIATKNLPADAIKKVQVFNKKSDQAEFTGIDDGTRDKTINLQLKDEKKHGYFGDIEAGGGNKDHYKSSGKVYNFKDKTQFAALGMLNNINQFGFSFNDYINFVGGMRSMMSGGGGSMQFTMNSSSNLPINFGQPVTGLIASGAGDMNYTYEPHKNNRFNISYLASGADKKLEEQVYSENFTNAQSFNTRQTNSSTNIDRAHRAFVNWKMGNDTSQKLILSGNISLNNSKAYGRTLTRNLLADSVINDLQNANNERASGYDATAKTTYLEKYKGDWNLFKVEGDIYHRQNLDNATWQNITRLVNMPNSSIYNQFQNNTLSQTNYSVNSSVTRRLGNGFYLEPTIAAGVENEATTRVQGTPPDLESNKTDSLSPKFEKVYQWFRPGLTLKKNSEDFSLTIGLRTEHAQLKSQLNNERDLTSKFSYVIPYVNLSQELGSGKRIAAYLGSNVKSPSAMQLNPALNNSNVFQLLKGNPYLKPEYSYNANVNASWFDQFSFTSLFIGLSGAYTENKITLSRFIDNNLVQMLRYVNSPYNANANANVHFSTPLKPLGVNLKIQLNENLNKGISYINNIENLNTTWSHEASLSFDNRKKDKWDINVGGLINYSKAKYSLQNSLNNEFINLAYFTDLVYTPNDKWNFTATADVNNYFGKSFPNTIQIPLLKAEVSYYCLKSNRGVLSMQVFDILNKNTGLSRSSNLNMLTQTQSNIIGRYVMFSFKYRLTKLGGDGGGGFQIKMNSR